MQIIIMIKRSDSRSEIAYPVRGNHLVCSNCVELSPQVAAKSMTKALSLFPTYTGDQNPAHTIISVSNEREFFEQVILVPLKLSLVIII